MKAFRGVGPTQKSLQLEWTLSEPMLVAVDSSYQEEACKWKAGRKKRSEIKT
jgi:hypothetical protein